ncbi:alpha-keto acid decarboxylase family protein [Chloroflexota bacterium]
MSTVETISDYLIQQLSAHGVDHVFGIPGDYALVFYHELEQSDLQVINTGDEQGAGFAADAYARIRGLGVVCITYCVGGLKVTNTTAQAFAEKSPVVVISGAPGIHERSKNPLLHHKVKDFDTQLKIFEQLTVASTVLNNPETAAREIDRVLAAALRYKRPVYIELPRDMVSAPYTPAHTSLKKQKPDSPEALQEAIRETAQVINAARQPVIIAGVELHRFGLQDALIQLIEKTNIPFAATLLSKSIVSEYRPQYLGVYEGAMGHEDVREYVESSDCLILLGAFMTDINLGIFTAHLDQGRSISASSEKTTIHYHTYEDVYLPDFIQGLLEADIEHRELGDTPHPEPPSKFQATEKPITVQRLFQRLNSFIDDNTVVVADTGDAMFAAADMSVHSRTQFLSPAYYTSLGFAVPACIGAQLADPDLRPLVLVGDGAFQMTGMELGTVVRFNLNPIVIVLNNRGYSTERPMLEGAFNDIPFWKFSHIPELLGAGRGFDVKTEVELDEALETARLHTESFCILDVHLDPHDISPALQRLTRTLAKRVRQGPK